MFVILRILTAIVVVVVLLAVGAVLLPRHVSVARSVTIDAPAAEIFPYVNALQQTEAWSPWLDRDPDVQLTYSGPEAGVGNTMVWVSEHPQVGSGRQEITASTPDARVETALDFGDMGTANAFFDLVDQGEGTELTWGFTTDTGYNPMARWMGLMMDRWVGGDYELGLARLKDLVEQR